MPHARLLLATLPAWSLLAPAAGFAPGDRPLPGVESPPVVASGAAVAARGAAVAARPGAQRPVPARPGDQRPGAARPGAERRPVLLLLPGRGYLARDTAGLRQDWLHALNRGLAAEDPDVWLTEDDLRLVWYADALDPRAPDPGCADPDGRRPAMGSGRDLAALLAAGMSLAALLVEGSGEMDGEPLRALAGDLLFFGDDLKRCAAEGRLAEALARAEEEDRPIVLVAHSFGSLVAYSHLLDRDPAAGPAIERLVTVGSLVGRAEVRELMLGPEARAAELPEGVGSWVNVRDPDDVLAAPLGEVRARDEAAGAVVDTVTEGGAAGDHPHDPARYLADPVTARAVLEVVR